MYKPHLISKSLALTVFACVFASNAFAVPSPYFIMDFDDMDINDPQPITAGVGMPIIALPPSWENNYGAGNFFVLSDTTAHSAPHSLRFTYEARNGLCNTCGLYKFEHKTGLDGVNYTVAESGEDLSRKENESSAQSKDGPAAKPGRLVYNKTNGFSKWEVVSVDDENLSQDRLSLKLLADGITGLPAEFNSEDEVQIARQCGVDGHIGRDIVRRNDCNNAINWFTQVPAQEPGKSIFRRQYLKAEITSGEIHQKLHYVRLDHGGDNAGNIIVVAESRKLDNFEPNITGLNRYGAEFSIYRTSNGNLPADLIFERSVWYYLEEQFKAATLNPNFEQAYLDTKKLPSGDDNPDFDPEDPRANKWNADGEYRIWFNKSGEESNTPLIEHSPANGNGLRLPPMAGGGASNMSLWGNMQHDFHSRGSWYIDDIYIDDNKIGPVVKDGINESPPSTPTVN